MRRLTIVIIAAVSVAIAIGAAGLVTWQLRLDRATYLIDGESIRVPAADAPVRSVLWAPATKVSGLNSSSDDSGPEIGVNGATLYIDRRDDLGVSNLYTSSRTSDGWATPDKLEISSHDDDIGPAISPDGQLLVFASNRTDGAGEFDLWISRRGDGSWGPPVNAGAHVNSSDSDYGPSLSPDGRWLYFASNRPRADGARSEFDLFRCRVFHDGFGDPERLAGVSTAANECTPAVSPGGDFLVFASDREGGEGGFDLYRARLDGIAIGAVESLGEPINTTANELDPSLSAHGFELLFSSDRITAEGDPAVVEYDIYRAVSREVFRFTDREQAAVDWAKLWAVIGPWLLLALLALLLLLLFLRLPKGAIANGRWRRLSLLAKCLLLSLVLHALLLAILGVVHVSTTIGEMLERGGTRVRITSSAVADSVTNQLQASAVSLETPAAEDVTSARSIAVNRRDHSVAVELESAEQEQSDAALDRAAPSAATPERIEVAELTQVDQEQLPQTRTPEIAAREQVAEQASAAPVDASSTLAAPTATTPAGVDAAQLMPALTQVTSGALSAPEVAASQTAVELSVTDAPQPASDVERAMPSERSEVVVEAHGQSQLQQGESTRAQPASEEATTSVVEIAAATPSVQSQALPTTATSAAAPTQLSEPVIESQPSVEVAEKLSVPVPAQQQGSGEASTVARASQTRSTRASVQVDEAATRTAEFTPTNTSRRPTGIASAADTPASSSRVPVAQQQTEIPLETTLAGVATPRAVPTSESEQSAESPPTLVSDSARSTAAPVDLATPDVRLMPEADDTSDRQLAMITEAADAIDGRASIRPSQPGELSLAPTSMPSVALPVTDGAGEASAETAVDVTMASSANAPRNTVVAAGSASASVEFAASRTSERVDQSLVATSEHQGAPGRSVESDVAAGDFDLPTIGMEYGLPTETGSSGAQERASAVAVESSGERPSFERHDASVAAARMDVVGERTNSTPRRLDSSRDQAAAGAPLSEPLEPHSVPFAVLEAIDTPLETEPIEHHYAQRAPEVREELVEARGGSQETEEAVAAALDWLARHQRPDGRWSSRLFDHECGACSGAAQYEFDNAVTGLALLCFYGAGHTHQKEGPYRERVDRALRWLLSRQSTTGDLRRGETMYTHGIAAIALCEAFGMTGDPELREPAQRAIDFITNARNRRVGGWRYEPGQPGDTSVLGWQVMALASAERCGLEVSPVATGSARDWLRQVSDPRTPGLYAYQPGMPPTRSMTAEGMFVAQLLGMDRDDRRMGAGERFILSELPNWDRSGATYYWYYATLALFQQGGEPWRRWNEALVRELLANQRVDGNASGSWDPTDRWSRTGGRVYQTAICALSLEVYYRYLPLYVDDPNAVP